MSAEDYKSIYSRDSNYFVKPIYSPPPYPEDEWTYDNKWHTFDIMWNTSYSKFLKDGVVAAENMENSAIPSGSLSVTIGDTGQWGGGPSNTETNVDWVFVRKYASPEPEVMLGEDVSTIESSLSVSGKSNTGYLVKGKIASTFKEDLKNIIIAVYDKDPKDSTSQELARVTVDKLNALKETDFKISVPGSNNKINELFISVDPDNKIAESNKANNIAKKKIPADIIETMSPFLISASIFYFYLLF